MNEELKKLFEGSELSEEFKTSVSVLFESAVQDKVDEKEEEIRQKTEEFYEQKAQEYTEYVVEQLQEKADSYINDEVLPMVEKYLDYSVDQFLVKNEQVAIDTVKVNAAEQFLKGFSSLAESFNVDIPEGKETYVEKIEQEKKQLQERFDKSLDEVKELQEQIKIIKMGNIVDAQVVDLTESQKEKFFEAAATVSFKNEEQYKSAISKLYESYFPSVREEDQQRLEEQRQGQEDQTVVIVEEQKDKWLEDLFSRV